MLYCSCCAPLILPTTLIGDFMTLSPTEFKLFLKLWSCIDSYVAEEANLFSFSRSGTYAFTPPQQRKLRAHLRDHPELLEQFIRSNPCELSPNEMSIVHGFRNAVRGMFFVERCLKKHAIFIGLDPSNAGVYVVGGLSQRIEEVLSGHCKIMVDVALLPFLGHIVWDGVVEAYNLHIGPGMRGEFKDQYMRAKERGELITSLPPGSHETAAGHTKPRKPGRDWRPAMDEIVTAVEKLGRPRTTMQRAAFRLLKYAALLARETLEEPSDPDKLSTSLRGLTRTHKQVITAIDRELWL